ncbi:uncharacterized protein GBIM_11797 [Gryllus bimaculatus]|nr:uncharacterized protein GBIM_11797 [Gryllus bimaculatus]
MAANGDILELELTEGNHWGIGLRIPNSQGKGSETIEVANLFLMKDKDTKWIVKKEKLEEFWRPGLRIRINNESDRTQQYHEGDQIRKQVEFALQSKQKWHNPQHFAHWCRHGEVVPERKRQGSDVTKWGSLSATAGAWMFMRSRKRHNTE